jgi:DNA repair exonuclease SbcCD ATPase subunit
MAKSLALALTAIAVAGCSPRLDERAAAVELLDAAQRRSESLDKKDKELREQEKEIERQAGKLDDREKAIQDAGNKLATRERALLKAEEGLKKHTAETADLKRQMSAENQAATRRSKLAESRVPLVTKLTAAMASVLYDLPGVLPDLAENQSQQKAKFKKELAESLMSSGIMAIEDEREFKVALKKRVIRCVEDKDESDSVKRKVYQSPVWKDVFGTDTEPKN